MSIIWVIITIWRAGGRAGGSDRGEVWENGRGGFDKKGGWGWGFCKSDLFSGGSGKNWAEWKEGGWQRGVWLSKSDTLYWETAPSLWEPCSGRGPFPVLGAGAAARRDYLRNYSPRLAVVVVVVVVAAAVIVVVAAAAAVVVVVIVVIVVVVVVVVVVIVVVVVTRNSIIDSIVCVMSTISIITIISCSIIVFLRRRAADLPRDISGIETCVCVYIYIYTVT